mgnify:CR=1 FL=1
MHPVPTAVASTDQQDRAHHSRRGGWVGGFVRAGRNADGQDYTTNISTAVPFLNISSTGMSSRAEHGCVGVSSDAVGVVPSVSRARLGVLQQPIMCEGGILVGEPDGVIVTTAVEPLLSECRVSLTWEQGSLTLLK